MSSGHTISHCVPLYEGYPLNHGIKTVNVGGRDIKDYLVKLLAEREHLEREHPVCYVQLGLIFRLV